MREPLPLDYAAWGPLQWIAFGFLYALCVVAFVYVVDAAIDRGVQAWRRRNPSRCGFCHEYPAIPGDELCHGCRRFLSRLPR